MNIDRPLQRTILESLRDVYPEIANLVEDMPYKDHPDLMSNLFYLEEHGLILSKGKRANLMGTPSIIFTAKITAIGLDFLEDDGGLSTILNKLTIKIDDNQFRELLLQKVTASVPTEQKSEIVKTIKSLPGEALKTICMRLVNLGLDTVPDAVHLIQTYAGQSF